MIRQHKYSELLIKSVGCWNQICSNLQFGLAVDRGSVLLCFNRSLVISSFIAGLQHTLWFVFFFLRKMVARYVLCALFLEMNSVRNVEELSYKLKFPNTNYQMFSQLRYVRTVSRTLWIVSGQLFPVSSGIIGEGQRLLYLAVDHPPCWKQNS